MDYKLLDSGLSFVQKNLHCENLQACMILGSGWTDVIAQFDIVKSISFDDIPGYGKATIAGHAGQLHLAKISGAEMLIFQGRRHWYEGVGWNPIALPTYIAKSLGAKTVMLTNAAGSINSDFKPSDLMCITDHINLTGNHPLIGDHNEFWGPRFPDMSTTYDPSLIETIVGCANKLNFDLKQGVYCGVTGPTYETPAEIQMIKRIGGDAVGMSTIHEAILANAAGLKVIGLSCITNFAAGILQQPLDHKEVHETAQKALPRISQLIKTFWGKIL